MRLARSGALLGVAHGVELSFPFARNVVMARFMEPREFALAITLTSIVGIAELATDIGVPQFAVRTDLADRDGRGTLHALAASRAVMVGVAIAALALPLSRVFDAPGDSLAFALTGAVVAMRGFTDFAFKQRGRGYDFSAEAVVILASQSVWTAAVIGLSVLWGDHRATVAGLLLYAASFVVISHLISPMPYRFRWKPDVVRAVRDFGRPLLANGVFLAVTSLGDRMVVGARVGLDALALYGPLVTTALLPRGTALRFVNNLCLPAMVKAVEKGETGERPMRAWIAVISLLAVAFPLGFMALAEPVIRLTFGARYAPSPALASSMALLLFCRFVVTYPVPLAIATGRTWFVTASSALSATSLIPAALSLFFLTGATVSERLLIFVGAMAAVETVGAVVIAVRTAQEFPASRGLLRAASLAMALVYGVVVLCEGLGADAWTTRLPLAAVATAIAGAVFGPPLRRFLRPGTAAP